VYVNQRTSTHAFQLLWFKDESFAPTEEERVELAVAARAGEIFEETGLFILCAALDPSAK
jgi:hypothetical protein